MFLNREERIMDKNVLLTAAVIGGALQVAMVVIGHAMPGLRDPGFAIGGMGFSAVAGWLYARSTYGRWGDAIGGGAIAGGVTAAIGIMVSVALGDVPVSLIGLGTAASVVTGIIGAGVGKLMRRA